MSMANNINWEELKVIVFESDDWGGLGCLDIETHRRATQTPAVVRTLDRIGDLRVYHDGMDTLESVADLDALFKLLLRFPGGDGRPAAFTTVYFLANPDFDAIEASGFTEYIDRGIDKPFPPEYQDRGDIISKALEGIDLGVWFPESHNTRAEGHFDPNKWVKFLHDRTDPGYNAFFEFKMIGKPSERSTDKGEEFDSLTVAEIGEWIRTGTQYFHNAFGYAPHVSGLSSARARGGALEETVARLLSQNGVEVITNAVNKSLGHYDPGLGLTYIRRNACFEPALYKKDRHAPGWLTSCYEEVEQAWASNHPAIVNTHRVNYTSLAPERRARSLNQLEQLLTRIQTEHPEAVYRSSWEVGRMYRDRVAAS